MTLESHEEIYNSTGTPPKQENATIIALNPNSHHTSPETTIKALEEASPRPMAPLDPQNKYSRSPAPKLLEKRYLSGKNLSQPQQHPYKHPPTYLLTSTFREVGTFYGPILPIDRAFQNPRRRDMFETVILPHGIQPPMFPQIHKTHISPRLQAETMKPEKPTQKKVQSNTDSPPPPPYEDSALHPTLSRFYLDSDVDYGNNINPPPSYAEAKAQSVEANPPYYKEMTLNYPKLNSQEASTQTEPEKPFHCFSYLCNGLYRGLSSLRKSLFDLPKSMKSFFATRKSENTKEELPEKKLPHKEPDIKLERSEQPSTSPKSPLSALERVVRTPTTNPD